MILYALKFMLFEAINFFAETSALVLKPTMMAFAAIAKLTSESVTPPTAE